MTMQVIDFHGVSVAHIIELMKASCVAVAEKLEQYRLDGHVDYDVDGTPRMPWRPPIEDPAEDTTVWHAVKAHVLDLTREQQCS